jgi:hypothetical protein
MASISTSVAPFATGLSRPVTDTGQLEPLRMMTTLGRA